MSNKTAKREDLARTAALVRPALATKDYVPVLMHIHFAGDTATAFNDAAAIGVHKVAADLDCCVPGEMLIRALASFGGQEVLFQPGKDGALTLKSGRSTLRVPTLPAGDFPFEWPGADEGTELDLGREMVRAIERCLISVGSDPNHPAQMGVTMEAEGGFAVFYSTDNLTVSRCATGARAKLPGDAPVILPRFFCEQLVSLAKTFPDARLVLVVLDGALLVEVGNEASLLSKTLVDVTPVDFPRIVRKHCDLAGLADSLVVIPDQFDAALGRALLVTAGEVIRSAKVSIKGGQLRMRATSGAGDSDDDMALAGAPDESFTFDAALVQRGAKACALVGFTDKVTVMADSKLEFVHLIAHVA